MVASALLLGGCVHLATELDKQNAAVRTVWDEANHRRADSAVESLGWSDAVARLAAANPKILAAELDLVRAREAFAQVPRSLIPTLDLQAGYNRSLAAGSAATLNPFTFALNGFFDIPGVLNYHARYAAALLGVLHAELAHDLVLREQTVELARVFLDARRAAATEAQLARRRAATAALPAGTLPGEDGPPAGRPDPAAPAWQGRLGDLLARPGTRWQLADSPPPVPEYGRDGVWPEPAALAQLPLRLAAVELVALRARQLGLDLRAWPVMNVYVTSPAFFQSAAGQTSFWSSQDLFAGANLDWAFDTHGQRDSDRRVLDAEIAVEQQRMREEAARLADRLQTALDSLRHLDTEAAALAHQRAAIQANDPSNLALLASVDARLPQLAAERREGDLVLWFFDDARWSALPSFATTQP